MDLIKLVRTSAVTIFQRAVSKRAHGVERRKKRWKYNKFDAKA